MAAAEVARSREGRRAARAGEAENVAIALNGERSSSCAKLRLCAAESAQNKHRHRACGEKASCCAPRAAQ